MAGGFVNAGKGVRAPLKLTWSGGSAIGFMIAIWLLAIYNALVAAHICGLQLKAAHPSFVVSRVRVGTFVDALVAFFVILYLTRRWGWKVSLGSTVIDAAEAPMIFECPFDLIVTVRTNPSVPTHPTLYR